MTCVCDFISDVFSRHKSTPIASLYEQGKYHRAQALEARQFLELHLIGDPLVDSGRKSIYVNRIKALVNLAATADKAYSTMKDSQSSDDYSANMNIINRITAKHNIKETDIDTIALRDKLADIKAITDEVFFVLVF